MPKRPHHGVHGVMQRTSPRMWIVLCVGFISILIFLHLVQQDDGAAGGAEGLAGYVSGGSVGGRRIHGMDRSMLVQSVQAEETTEKNEEIADGARDAQANPPEDKQRVWELERKNAILEEKLSALELALTLANRRQREDEDRYIAEERRRDEIRKRDEWEWEREKMIEERAKEAVKLAASLGILEQQVKNVQHVQQVQQAQLEQQAHQHPVDGATGATNAEPGAKEKDKTTKTNAKVEKQSTQTTVSSVASASGSHSHHQHSVHRHGQQQTTSPKDAKATEGHQIKIVKHPHIEKKKIQEEKVEAKPKGEMAIIEQHYAQALAGQPWQAHASSAKLAQAEAEAASAVKGFDEELLALIHTHSATLDAMGATSGHRDDKYLVPFFVRCVDIVLCWPGNFTLGLSDTMEEVRLRFKSSVRGDGNAGRWIQCPGEPLLNTKPSDDPQSFPFQGLDSYVFQDTQPKFANEQNGVQQKPQPLTLSQQLEVVVKERMPMVNAYLRRVEEPLCTRRLLHKMLSVVVDWEVQDGVVESQHEHDGIIAFSLGSGPYTDAIHKKQKPGYVRPGLSNFALAAAVLRVFQINPRLSLYTQWEVGDLLTGYNYTHPAPGISAVPMQVKTKADESKMENITTILGAVNRSVENVITKRMPDDESHHLSTRSFSEQIPNWLRQLDGGGSRMKLLYILAHPDHKKRAKRETERMLAKKEFEHIKVVFPEASLYGDWKDWGCDDWGYDHSSTQSWTVHRAWFLTTEMKHKLGLLNNWIFKEINCTRSTEKANGGK